MKHLGQLSWFYSNKYSLQSSCLWLILTVSACIWASGRIAALCVMLIYNFQLHKKWYCPSTSIRVLKWNVELVEMNILIHVRHGFDTIIQVLYFWENKLLYKVYSYRWTKHYTLVAWEYLRWTTVIIHDVY